MNDKSFTISLLIRQTPEQAFDLINNVHHWWTGEPGVEGSANKMDDEFTYRHKHLHYSKQKVKERIPAKKITWLVTESKISFVQNKNEWTETEIVFEIIAVNNQTEIRFSHLGLAPDKECYDSCSNAWDFYIRNSLKNYLAKYERQNA